MKKDQNHRYVSKKHKNLSRKLINYSIAAGAALAVAQPADAAVQYSGIRNITVSNDFVLVDLDGDGQNDFAFLNHHWSGTGTDNGVHYRYGYGYNFLIPRPDNASIIYAYTTWYPAARLMNASQSADPAGGPWTSFYYNVLGAQYTSYAYPGPQFSSHIGQFIGKTGYIGVRFDISGSTHYGWIRARVAANCSSTTIIDWAYEDQADTPIHIQGPAINIPTLNEWGVLILMGLILMEGTRRIKRSREEE